MLCNNIVLYTILLRSVRVCHVCIRAGVGYVYTCWGDSFPPFYLNNVELLRCIKIEFYARYLYCSILKYTSIKPI